MSTPHDAYNYSTFRPTPYIAGGCDGPSRGDDLSDLTVHSLDRSLHRLDELVHRLTVIETGSTTCPLYCAQVDPMRTVADRHPEADFVVLYTREAHPGERRGPHVGIDDKIDAASRLAEETREWRTVWVDGIDGPLHRTLSTAPNAVVVLDGDARVVAWLHDSDPRVLNDILVEHRKGGVSTMRSTFRPPGPAAIRALFRGGWKAVADFVFALPALVRYRLSGGANC